MILLIKPPPADNPFSLDMALKTEPLELELIGAMLREQGIPYYIYEASLDSLSLEEVLKIYRPKAAALTGYITQEYVIKDYIRRIKFYDNTIITIAGGSHAQLNYEHFFMEDLSYLCRSDNIYAILELLAYEETYDTIASWKKNRCDIDGLCYQEDGGWHVNEVQPFDINLLPIPDRSQCIRYSSHYRYLDVTPVALIKTSSSCPYHCSFCYGRLLNKGTYCQRDLQKVIEEIKTIAAPYIQIVDDDFLCDKKRLECFISLMEENNIQKTFICYGRSDFICQEADLIKRLIQIGFRYIMVGLEAVSDDTLDSYQKHTSTNINTACIRILQESGANVVGLFIVDIHFRKRDFNQLRKFIRQSGLYYIGVSLLTPIPGTKLYEQYEAKLLTHNMEKWDFMHLVVPPVHMSRFRFYLEYYLLVLDLFRIANKKGIYRFIRLNDYKAIFLKLLVPWGSHR